MRSWTAAETALSCVADRAQRRLARLKAATLARSMVSHVALSRSPISSTHFGLSDCSF